MMEQSADTIPRILISYPKSGRTWLRFALASAGLQAVYTHGGASLINSDIGRSDVAISADLRLYPLVFLDRNPIDTAVSFFYQTTQRIIPVYSVRWFKTLPHLALRRAMPPRDIDTFVLSPLYGVPKVCAFNRMWLNHIADRGDCLALRYEEMRIDPAAGFQRILDFWGEKSVTGLALANASSIEKMRVTEMSGASQFSQSILGRSGRALKNPNAAKVRRAVVGGYVDELRPETIAKCREIAAGFGFYP